ncbi:unnamed protein product [Closterium sp. NIES-54]
MRDRNQLGPQRSGAASAAAAPRVLQRGSASSELVAGTTVSAGLAVSGGESAANQCHAYPSKSPGVSFTERWSFYRSSYGLPAFGESRFFKYWIRRRVLFPLFSIAAGYRRNYHGSLSVYCTIVSKPTFIDIFKKRSADKHSSAPYLCGLLSSFVWTIYGSPVVANAFSVFVISILGLLFNGSYCLIFYLFSTEHKRFIGATITSIVLCAAMMASLAVSVIPSPARPLVFGLSGDCTSTASFAAPLTAVAQMIQTRSVEFFPIQLCAVSLVHTIVWTAYGASSSDIFVAAPNFLGLLLSAVQVFLYMLYRRSSPKRISSLPIRTSAADAAAAAATIASYTTPLIPPSASNPPSPLSPSLPGGRPSFVAAAAAAVAAASAMASAASAAAAHAGRGSSAAGRGSQDHKEMQNESEVLVVPDAYTSSVGGSARRSGYTRLSSSEVA